MQQYLVDGFELHSLSGINFKLNIPLEGLDAPDSRDSNYERVGESGGVISAGLYGMRPVALTGRIIGSTALQHEQNRRAFLTALKRQVDASGYPVLRRHQFTTLSGATYFFYAQTTKITMPHKYNGFSDFQVQLLAPDPQLYSDSLVDSGSVSLPTAAGITWPVTWPLTFGGVSGGSVTIDNPGDIYSWPIIRLTGPLTNPYLVNLATGKLMQLNYTIPGGSYVDIYMGDTVDATGNHQLGKRIMANGTDNLISTKTDDSDWWAIEPGQQVISFSSGNSGDTGTMDIQFYPAVTGI